MVRIKIRHCRYCPRQIPSGRLKATICPACFDRLYRFHLVSVGYPDPENEFKLSSIRKHFFPKSLPL